MYNRKILEEVQPSDPWKDGRVAVWPDNPPVPTQFIIVGEAPGKTEVLKGQVFCGRSGQLLRELVADVGLEGVHYTNTSLFRPSTESKDKPPPAAIWKQERPRLLLEISMLKPRAIICVGTTAAEVLLGNVPRMRGMVKELTLHGQTYPVYITHHPAYVTYEPDQYRDLVVDLQRAKEGQVPERFTPRVLAGDAESLRGNGTGLLAVDTEATSTYPGDSRILCATVSDGRQTYSYTPDTLPLLARALETYTGRIVGHNSSFDEALLRRQGVPIVFTDDTLLLHYSQDERKGSHGLKTLGPTIAGKDTGIDLIWPYTHGGAEGDEDDSDGGGNGWDAIPTDVLLSYCAGDSAVTWELYRALQSRGDSRTSTLYSYLCRARAAFSDGLQHGVRVDRAALSLASTSAEERVAQLAKEFGFNPESQPQTLAAMREAGYKVDSVAEDVLRDLEGDLPSKLLAFREQNKLLKGFLRPLQEFTKESEYVYPTYKLHGTDSGRTSCADPNMQQVPPELRHLFIASPGKVLLGWDYRAHEVRGIALLSRDKQLCELLRAPSADPHQWVAEHIGMGRQEGKHTLFAVAYGAGEAKLVKALGIKPGAARRAVETVRHLFPGLTAWREKVVQQMYEQGYVETPYYHRRRHFDYVDEHTAPHQERVAVNYLPQSLCADVALDSAVSVWEELGLAPLVFVHDFNAVEVVEERAEEYRERCQEIASAICPNEWVQFLPDMYVGHSWKEMKP